MPTTADFRNGLCLVHKGALYTILSFQHVKPGKGPAFVRTKLKNIETRRVVEHTFTAGVKIQTARVVRKSCQYTYRDGSGYHFMDTHSYEEVIVAPDMVPHASWLKEGQEGIEVLFYEEKNKLLGCELPASVWLEVIQTGVGAKGDTVNKATKPAVVETHATLQVPLFIEEGDWIRIDTREGSYQERKKSDPTAQ